MVNVDLRLAFIAGLPLPEGAYGKKLVFTRDVKFGSNPIGPKGEIGDVVAQVTQQLQMMIPMNPTAMRGVAAIDKVVLVLTEDEYDHLGIKFRVNDIYSVSFEHGCIKFRGGGESGT